MSGPHSTAKTIFLDCLEIDSADARHAYLEQKCGGDQALRREVEELLRHHHQIGQLPYEQLKNPNKKSGR